MKNTELEAMMVAMMESMKAMQAELASLKAKEPETTSAKPKATTKTTKKASSTKSKKSNDDFDDAKYRDIAKKAGCLGKHGVWKACRPWVYAVMAGDMTQKACNAKVKAFKDERGW